TLCEPVLQLRKIVDSLVHRKEFIKDTIFIFGVTAIGVFDLRPTPFEKIFPGAEIHPNVIDNLMSRNFLRPPPKEKTYMLLGLAVLGIAMSFALAHAGALVGLLCTFFTLIALTILDQMFLFSKGWLATIALPMSLVSFIYVFMTFYKYLTEERKKKYLKSTFSKYVSPAIVDEILKDPDNVELGGKKQRMSVFFSDVRGFTTISEKLDPQVLSAVLNDYLTPMTQIVFANKGTLDKYIGDAVMAFFGAPIPYADHAKYACRTALQSLVKLKELQKQFEERGLPHIDVGIGINTAEMSVGNMGSDIVRNYTVMGDAVNLGARLEGTTKEYGIRIIISEFTYGDVKDSFTAREIDWVRVKGKNQPIRIYELMCEGKPTEPEVTKMLEAFARGFKLYHERKFNEALAAFNEALTHVASDPVSTLFVERCQDYLAEPPPPEWDGVFVMKTK
ncbi:MAG: adenylate/guanylate cyclase domain-containing protein, partial [Pseudobdellovibrionaceae bacterium]